MAQTNKIYFSEALLLTKTYNLNDFKDWLYWHLNVIGFDHVHVFDNESTVDIKSICMEYGCRVSYELVTGWPNQYALYNRYINNESQSWWVLPIDDDEFLDISVKYRNNVNYLLTVLSKKWPDMNKLSIRWKNMFPKNIDDIRDGKSLMQFCTNNNEKWAELFSGGNKPVKTFVLTVYPVLYNESTSETHNPICCGLKSYLCNGERLKGNWYYGPSTDNDVRILHYQFKSAAEWRWKCHNRLAIFGNKPFIYTKGQEGIIDKMRNI